MEENSEKLKEDEEECTEEGTISESENTNVLENIIEDTADYPESASNKITPFLEQTESPQIIKKVKENDFQTRESSNESFYSQNPVNQERVEENYYSSDSESVYPEIRESQLNKDFLEINPMNNINEPINPDLFKRENDLSLFNNEAISDKKYKSDFEQTRNRRRF